MGDKGKKLLRKTILLKTALIPLEKVQLCDAYQRTVNKKQVRDIVSNLELDALSPPVIGRREDDSYWVVDGQQRIIALKQLGIKKLTCRLFESQGPWHEAMVFRLTNKHRTNVSPLVIFKALIAEKDSNTLSILWSVERCGYRIAFNKEGGWPNLTCVVCLNNIFDRGGSDLLEDVLNLVREIWEGEDAAATAIILESFSVLLKEFPEIDRDRLAKVLSPKRPEAVIRSADAFRLTSGSRALAVERAIVDLYNRRLKNKRLQTIV